MSETDGVKGPALCTTTNFGSAVVPAVSADFIDIPSYLSVPSESVGSLFALSLPVLNPNLDIPLPLTAALPVAFRVSDA